MSQNGSEDSPFLRIRHYAEATPGALALAAPDRKPLTYARLWNRIEDLADTFASEAGDIIALSLPDGPDLAALILAISMRCLCAPLNPKTPLLELHRHLASLAPAALIVEAGRQQEIAAAESLGIGVWELRATAGSEAGVFELSPRSSASHPRNGPRAEPGLLLHTSATTGPSKTVPLSHDNLVAQSFQTGGGLGLTENDRFLSLMPFFHLQGAGVIFFQLYVGGALICTPGFDAERFLGWLAEFQPTWYTASPTMHRAILTLLEDGRRALPCRLRLVRSIGAPLAPDLIVALEKALDAPVIEGYGMTEAGAVTGNPLPPGHRKPGSVGIMTGAEVGIFNASGQPLPHGEEGEIRLRGPGVTRGYWNDPEANQNSFRDGWLCTGDLGRFDEEGYLYVTGRVKELVNRGGEKIRPQEVDHVLAAHPAVADAAAFGIPHPTLGEDIAAAVVCRAGCQAAESELREFASTQLSAFKVPRHILFVNQIPKGATGKAQRAALREQYGSRFQLATVGDVTNLELQIADVWNRILHTEVGLDDDFFAAGGDSLAATIMLAEVRAALAVDPALLERVDFFENPTVRSLARIVAECGVTGNQPESALLALQPNGFHPPLFLLPDATSELYYFRGLAKHMGKDQPVLVLRYSSSDGPTGARTVEQVAARCLTVVRSVQPRGPYRIAGHCFGGMVAFEMARQVIAAGEQVDLLALLDTTTPGYPNPRKHWRAYARAMKGIFSREPGPVASARQALAHFRYLVARARLVGAARWRRLLATSPVAAVVPVRPTTAGANETAGRSYTPQPTAVRAVQFLAADQPTGTRILADPRLEWRRFALAGFEVRETPGDHLSMFAEPHVKQLAAQLRAELPGDKSAVVRALAATR